MVKYKIEIDQERCIGCGNCANICPNSFELKEGKAFAKRKETENIGCEEEAASSCPVEAITIKKVK